MAGYMMSSIKRPAVSATKAGGDQSSMPLEDALAILLQGKPAYHSLEIHHKVSEVVMSILEVNKTMMVWLSLSHARQFFCQTAANTDTIIQFFSQSTGSNPQLLPQMASY